MINWFNCKYSGPIIVRRIRWIPFGLHPFDFRWLQITSSGKPSSLNKSDSSFSPYFNHINNFIIFIIVLIDTFRLFSTLICLHSLQFFIMQSFLSHKLAGKFHKGILKFLEIAKFLITSHPTHIILKKKTQHPFEN